MKKYIISIVSLFLLIFVSCEQRDNFTPCQYVNTKIGTAGHGHVFVGANVPYGFVQLGPTSIPQQWDWCSGYHDTDSTIIGFSHTHLSGTGIGDLFDITVIPIVGEVNFARGVEEIQESGLWSYADRTKEISSPAYYSVPLTRYDILAELTATKRVGFHRYTFPLSDTPAIVFDLENGGCWDKATKTSFNIIKENDKIIGLSGYRFSTGWAKNQKIFFYAEFSRDIEACEIIPSSQQVKGEKFNLPQAYARVKFKPTQKGEQILVKVALSPVSEKNARENLNKEIAGWDFDKIHKQSVLEWNKELAKIKITDKNIENKKIFYTSLYHTMIAPSIFSDVNGEYRGSDDKIHNDGFTNYTTFSLWDTYRAAQPLMTILHPEKMKDIIETMLHIYSQQGKLPVWHLMANETDCMVGNPGIIVVADAIIKGIKGFDIEKAFEAMKKSAMLDERGQNLRKQYGYIPADLYNEAIAHDMEYAIADAALANVAQKLGKKDEENFFRQRSFSYRNYMDTTTLLARGRFANGAWREPFNPFEANHRENDYCEGNAWQYTWLVPHDFEWLIKFYGSKEKLVNRLDTLFSLSSKIEGDNTSPDISGLIGQYVHGNEPSHHIIYFYTMAGYNNKAAQKIREVLETMYSTKKDGLSGNEDVGQMSAWYILSSLGFYQVEPASTRYYFGSPLFDKAEIQVEKGKFTIITKNNSKENKYIKAITLNGKNYKKNYIDYKDIVAGGELIFKMTK